MWDKIVKQTKAWAIAAWTLPFVALAILINLEILGLDTIKEYATIAISVTFFTVSVFWWWWVMAQIRYVFKCMEDTSQSFNEIKKDLAEIKKDVVNPNNR